MNCKWYQDEICTKGDVIVNNQNIDVLIKDLKYYLENNEENGVVYFPKFQIEKIIESLKEMGK